MKDYLVSIITALIILIPAIIVGLIFEYSDYLINILKEMIYVTSY